MKHFLVFVMASLFALAGCKAATQFHVEVDSLSSYSPSVESTYLLLPGNKDTQRTDLQFQEFSQYLKRVLEEQGFREVHTLDDADLAIFLGYAISGPKEKQYSYSTPVWGQTGYSSSSTYGTVNSFGNYSGITHHNPQYGITGYQQHSGSYTHFTRYMFLNAYDAREYMKTKKEIQVWKTTVTSTGSSNDLRLIFPYLIAASKDYLGKNTENKIQVIFKENDPAVLKVKGQSVELRKGK